MAVADTWTKIFEAAGKEEKQLRKFLTDGLHLNAEGYQVSANTLRDGGLPNSL